MPSLADVAAVLGPAKEKITLRDGLEVEIMGLSGAVIGGLLRRFPDEMGRIITQSRDAPTPEMLEEAIANPGANPAVERYLEKSRNDMMLSSEKLFPAIVAAGIGRPGDETEEAFAASLPVAVMSSLVAAIMRLSYVGSSRVDLQACKLEYSIVSPK